MSQNDTQDEREPQRALSAHILPTSATMIGVCITVISIVRLFEASGEVSTIIDKFVAVDSLVFLVAAVISYLSMRSRRSRARLENYADVAFLIGLGVLALAGFLVAWEVGNTAH